MKKQMEQGVKASKAVVNKVVGDVGTSKSAKMKALFDLGLEVKEISTIMQVRYNFVYNVVSNYANMNGIQLETVKKEGKKDQIIEMYVAGKSNKEISIELKTNYNYVFNVLKAYKASLPVVDLVKVEAAAE